MAEFRPVRASRLELWTLLGAATLTSILTGLALHSEGLAYPSFVVDPWCRQSTVRLPTWPEPPVEPGALVVKVEGQTLPSSGCSGALYALAAQAAARGQPSVRLVAQGAHGYQTLDAPLRRVSYEDIAFFFVLYLLAGWLVLFSGLLVLRLGGARPAAKAYFFWSAGAFLFLSSFFEFHTTAYVPFLFSVATGWVPSGWLALAYCFPAPPRGSGRILSRLVYGSCAALLGVGAAIALGALFGFQVGTLQRAVPFAAALALLVLSASVFLRLRGAEGRARTELVAAAWGFVIAPLAAALLIYGATLGDTSFHLLLPFLVVALPASLGWALVRYNILRSVEVLSLRLVLAPLLLASALLAGLAGVLLRLSSPSSAPGPTVAVTVILFAVGAWTGRAILRRLLFPAARRFRPSVQRLGDALGALREHDGIRAELQTAISSALGVAAVEALTLREVELVPELTADRVRLLRSGERVWQESAGDTSLWVPLRSMAELRGAIRLGPKQDGSLFTNEDLELLETLAAVGALALHNAQVVAEIDARRRLQVDAGRFEKELALGVVGAEISHEISYALNFFRHVLRRSQSGQALVGEDLEIAREEVDRLGRMVASLRKLAPPPPLKEEVVLAESVHRALRLIQQDTETHQTRVRLEIDGGCRLRASADGVLQLLANLLRNAVQAAGTQGEVGVRARQGEGEWVVEVWDSGPGIPVHIEPLLFDPWVTARPGGTGLGMGICLRIARSFGWTLAYVRDGGRTVFRVRAPERP